MAANPCPRTLARDGKTPTPVGRGHGPLLQLAKELGAKNHAFGEHE
jgi:hypothetical protein